MTEPLKPLRLVATCAIGLEPFVERELTSLGIESFETHPGAITFDGDWGDVQQVNRWSRVANRVLIELGTWNGQDGDALHAGARNLIRRRKSRAGVDLGKLLSPDRTFAVRATTNSSWVTDIRWIGMRLKDGLVDGQRDRHGRRSSVDRDDPDVPLRARLYKNQLTLLLDTSGQPLDHRGYRVETTEAPVREQLGAACVLAAEWDGKGPIVDPMCGSGTLLVEAAWWALGWPPSRLRQGFAFDRFGVRLPKIQEATISDRVLVEQDQLKLVGLDSQPWAIAAANKNLRQADLADHASLSVGDAFTTAPPEGPGLVLINPPYGERMERSADAWKRLGDLLKQRYTGYTAVVLAGGSDQGASIGLRPRRRYRVKNGPLDARILVLDLY